jgi:hypothetical protein
MKITINFGPDSPGAYSCEIWVLYVQAGTRSYRAGDNLAQ